MVIWIGTCTKEIKTLYQHNLQFNCVIKEKKQFQCAFVRVKRKLWSGVHWPLLLTLLCLRDNAYEQPEMSALIIAKKLKLKQSSQTQVQ